MFFSWQQNQNLTRVWQHESCETQGFTHDGQCLLYTPYGACTRYNSGFVRSFTTCRKCL